MVVRVKGCACSNSIKILFHFVLFGKVLACFLSLSDAYQYKCRVALWKHPRLRKYYFNRSRSTPLVKLWTTGPIQTDPKSWKSGKILTSIELSSFDPVHFRIEHLNRISINFKGRSSKLLVKWYSLSMKNDTATVCICELL